MSISNPVANITTRRLKYTYEPKGDKLWHFSPNQCGLSNSMEMNIMFFSGSGKEALEDVHKMLLFMLETPKRASTFSHPDIVRRNSYETEYVENLIANKDKWIVTLVPRNQFFKVGWASNDTI